MNISTSAVLVSPGLAVKGTMSITASEVYFEVDEDNADYKKLEPQVRRFIYTYFDFEFQPRETVIKIAQISFEM